jgi:beta-glucosidase
MNCAPANVSMRVLRETFLYAFQEALQKGGAVSVMASYNEVRGAITCQPQALARCIAQRMGL